MILMTVIVVYTRDAAMCKVSLRLEQYKWYNSVLATLRQRFWGRVRHHLRHSETPEGLPMAPAHVLGNIWATWVQAALGMAKKSCLTQ